MKTNTCSWLSVTPSCSGTIGPRTVWTCDTPCRLSDVRFYGTPRQACLPKQLASLRLVDSLPWRLHGLPTLRDAACGDGRHARRRPEGTLGRDKSARPAVGDYLQGQLQAHDGGIMRMHALEPVVRRASPWAPPRAAPAFSCLADQVFGHRVAQNSLVQLPRRVKNGGQVSLEVYSSAQEQRMLCVDEPASVNDHDHVYRPRRLNRAGQSCR
jgi:hypothetical protein